MAEPITAVVAIIGGTLAAFGGLGAALVRVEKRRFRAREQAWEAFAAHIGGTYTPGNESVWRRSFGTIVVERDHVRVRIACYTVSGGDSQVPFTHCQAQWALGAGPRVRLARKGFKHRVGEVLGQTDVSLGDAPFDAQFALRVQPEAAAWLLREAWPPSSLQDLRLNFSRAELTTEGRTLSLVWPGHEKDMARLGRAADHLIRLAGAGLGPLRAASRLPDAQVAWPSGRWNARTTPQAVLRRGPTLATLHYRDHRWRIAGSLAESWPGFTASVNAVGEPVGSWPRGLLPEGVGSRRALAGAHVVGRAPELSMELTSPPDAAALVAALDLLVRAGRAPSGGAFR